MALSGPPRHWSWRVSAQLTLTVSNLTGAGGRASNRDASFMSDVRVTAMRRVHIVTFAPDGGSRTVSLRRSLLIGGALLKVLLIVWAAFSLYLLLFRDTLVGKLVADQAQMRVEYEQKLAAERMKLDEAALQ
jgi:hypothetical protein